MGLLFELDKSNKVFRCTWEDRLTEAIFSEGYATVRRFLASHPGVRAINDFSGLTEVNVAIETIMSVALGARGGVEGVVVLVTPTDLTFGLARMFSLLGETLHPNHHVVRTIEEAYELLGVKDPHFVRMLDA